MPLELLLVLVVGGIAGITILLHLLGLSRPLTFDTAQDAKVAWHRARPDDIIKAVEISADKRSALVETNHGTGLAWSFGADSAARLIHEAELTETATGLRLSLPEFTAPRIDITLTPQQRSLWQSKLETAA